MTLEKEVSSIVNDLTNDECEWAGDSWAARIITKVLEKRDQKIERLELDLRIARAATVELIRQLDVKR